jgi:hypothetical protein
MTISRPAGFLADCLKAGASCGRWQGGGPGHVRDKARAPRMGVAAKRQRAKPG